jgi:predicted phosphodiesterase
MRLLVLSDLHLEFGVSLNLPAAMEYDAVVLAGDIQTPGTKAVQWAKRDSTFSGKPVILIPGNHEYYGHALGTELQQMRSAAQDSNVHILSRDVVVVAGVRFIGCTLWTDFQLAIKQDDGSQLVNVERALHIANHGLNDFRCIELQATVRNQYRERQLRRLMRAEDTLALHWTERDWLRRVLAEPFAGPTVVVTHHGPGKDSVHPNYASDWLTPAFVSDLPDSFFEVPALWIHGHTHTPFDYQRQGCRIVSNPRGYPQKDGTFENPAFNAGLVIDIPDADNWDRPKHKVIPASFRSAESECSFSRL